jgi:hypothetical protein
MSWVTLALGLIRDVATTEQGQEIINDIRSGTTGKRPPKPVPPREEELGKWRQSVEERISVTDRNIGMLVGMVNAQQEALVRIQERQRVWNIVLAAAVPIAVFGASLWWFFFRG